MMRIFLIVGVLATLVILGAAAFSLVSDPLGSRRELFEAQLEEAVPTAGPDQLVPDTDYREYQKQIVSRAGLWEPLVPPPAPAAKGIDVAKALEGIALMPGKIGSGASAKLRIRTPEAPKGSWFKKGGTVRENVVIQDITAEGVVFGVTEAGKSATLLVPFP